MPCSCARPDSRPTARACTNPCATRRSRLSANTCSLRAATDHPRSATTPAAPRDRTLLRYQLIDRLTIDEIGTIFKVHRATAARWLSKIRDDLVDRTRSMMADSLGVDTEEAASIVRLVQSQLDVSVVRHPEP